LVSRPVNQSKSARLEVGRRLDEIGGEVSRVEGSGDEDIGILDVLLEVGILALLQNEKCLARSVLELSEESRSKRTLLEVTTYSHPCSSQ